MLYSYTHDLIGAGILYDKESSQLGTAVTLDVSHKIIDGITANVQQFDLQTLGMILLVIWKMKKMLYSSMLLILLQSLVTQHW